MPDFLLTFALIAAVLTIAALASGIVERAPISFPMIFLGLGFLLGRFGILSVDAHSVALEVIAVLSLSFVLFLDAINLELDQLRQDWLITVLSLGPGTIGTVLLVAGAAAVLLHLPLIHALLLGAILASVDPVLLRDIVRDERIPISVRRSLQTEAGANDIIVLPIILVLATLALGRAGTAAEWLALLGRLFLLGPLVGVLVGTVSVFLMNQARSRTTISREYRALYGVGSILAAYVAGEAVGGSGFLAVFAAGAAVAAMDYDLCDCFLEYSEITSEMTMLLAFMLFGAVLSTMLSAVVLLPTLAFALFVLIVARPAAISLVLLRASLSGHARLFIAWFGPRGLSVLLFGLLLVVDDVPGGEQLLAVAGVVVVVSVFAHGLSAAPMAAWYGRAVARQTLAEEREGTIAGLYNAAAGSVPRVTPRELAAALASDNPPLVLDVRSRSSYLHEPSAIPGSIRVLPDRVTEWAPGQSRERSIVTYCT